MEINHPNMEYRRLGASGLKVSALGYGNWLTSDKPEFDERTKEMIKKCYELGINFFDTAEFYGEGQGEIAMGKAFKELNLPREQLVVATKIFWGGKGVNDVGLSRKHVIEGTKKCLKKLQLDYVDILYCHRLDLDTPIEETCRAFDYIINSGMALYWGTSEWPADKIMDAFRICDKLGLHRPITEQPEYSVFPRERFEKEYYFLFRDFNFGCQIWSPLAGGILTGKYLDGKPPGSRYDTDDPVIQENWEGYFPEGLKEHTISAIKGLKELADEIGCTLAQLCIAWTLYSPNCSTCLFGATQTSQIEENIKAIEVYKKLTPEINERIDKIVGTAPAPIIDYRKYKPIKMTR